jgi:hypothetical protein
MHYVWIYHTAFVFANGSVLVASELSDISPENSMIYQQAIGQLLIAWTMHELSTQ